MVGTNTLNWTNY